MNTKTQDMLDEIHNYFSYFDPNLVLFWDNLMEKIKSSNLDITKFYNALIFNIDVHQCFLLENQSFHSYDISSYDHNSTTLSGMMKQYVAKSKKYYTQYHCCQHDCNKIYYTNQANKYKKLVCINFHHYENFNISNKFTDYILWPGQKFSSKSIISKVINFDYFEDAKNAYDLSNINTVLNVSNLSEELHQKIKDSFKISQDHGSYRITENLLPTNQIQISYDKLMKDFVTYNQIIKIVGLDFKEKYSNSQARFKLRYKNIRFYVSEINSNDDCINMDYLFQYFFNFWRELVEIGLIQYYEFNTKTFDQREIDLPVQIQRKSIETNQNKVHLPTSSKSLSKRKSPDPQPPIKPKKVLNISLKSQKNDSVGSDLDIAKDFIQTSFSVKNPYSAQIKKIIEFSKKKFTKSEMLQGAYPNATGIYRSKVKSSLDVNKILEVKSKSQ